MKIDRKIIRDIEMGNESGFALIIVMLVLLMMTVLGLNAIMTSTTDIQISGNESTSVKALSVAEAGLNHAIRKLRGQDFDTLLTGITGSYNSGVSSTKYDLITTTSFDGGTYKVYLRNNNGDPGDAGKTSYNSDSDNKVTMISEATYSNVTKKIQADIERIAADFPIYAGIGIVGALQEIDIDGNAFSITGNNTRPNNNWPTTTCNAQSGIALGDCKSRCVIIGASGDPVGCGQYLPSPPNPPNTANPCYVTSSHTLTAQELNNLTGTGTPPVQTSPNLTGQAPTIQADVNKLIPLADRTISIDENTTMQNISWGTFDNPQVTYVKFTNNTDEKELRIAGNSTGYGILIIDASNSAKGGELDIRGNFDWYGIIIFTNYSEAEFGAGGNINIYGGMLLANTSDAEAGNELEIKGNTDFFYSCAAEQRAKNYSALRISAWHEVGS